MEQETEPVIKCKALTVNGRACQGALYIGDYCYPHWNKFKTKKGGKKK